MNRKILAIALCFAASSVSAEYTPGEAYSACEALNVSARTHTLVSLTDAQVEKGLCMVATLAGEGIARGHVAVQNACMEAGEHLMREFKRRWPSRDPHAVSKTC
jgi:hypothetical protein